MASIALCSGIGAARSYVSLDALDAARRDPEALVGGAGPVMFHVERLAERIGSAV
jgi:hypothetical protein